MIPRNDLRVGNKVSIQEYPGYIFDIVELNDKNTKVHPNVGFSTFISYEKLLPIPLTINHIKSLNFNTDEKFGDDSWYSRKVNNQLEIIIKDLGGANFDMFTINKIEENKDKFSRAWKLLFLHEFQNLDHTLSNQNSKDW